MTSTIPSYTLSIETIVCITPSSGTFQAGTVEWAAGIVGTVLGTALGVAIDIGGEVATAGAITPAVIGIPVITAAEGAVIAEGIAEAARRASVGIGQLLPDQVSVELNGHKIWPARDEFIEMKAGSNHVIDYRTKRTPNDTFIIRILEHDVFLESDELFKYEIRTGEKFTRFPITIHSESEGSIYMLIVSATLQEDEHELVNIRQKSQLIPDPETGEIVPVAGLQFYRYAIANSRLPDGEKFIHTSTKPQLKDFLERFRSSGWDKPQYYSTINVDVVKDRVHVTGRGGKGVELYRVFEMDWNLLGTCERFKDPNWTKPEYYSTIQTAVVGDELHLLGRGGAGVELYRWDESAGKWSELLGTCERFKDPNWAKPQYYSTIQSTVVGDTLYLLGRGGAGVELYRWDESAGKWSELLGTCERFKDPNWTKPQYYSTIQSTVVGDALYLLGRGGAGVELYRWDESAGKWSELLGTCERFKDPNWEKGQYYSTIQTAVVGNSLYLLGRGGAGVELYRWDESAGKWSDLLGTCERFKDPDWEKPEYYSTIQTAVVGNTLYLLGRGAGGIDVYRWTVPGGAWSGPFGRCEAFKDSLAKAAHRYATIGSFSTKDGFYVYGRLPGAS